MAAKKSKKASKTLGKKSMKKTKGGAVDAFIKNSTNQTTLNTTNLSGLSKQTNFLNF